MPGRGSIKESVIEREVKIRATHNGWLTMEYKGERGYPDRIFIKEGVTVWLELKQPGKKPGDAQNYRIDQLDKAGANVGWSDSLLGAINILKHYQN